VLDSKNKKKCQFSIGFEHIACVLSQESKLMFPSQIFLQNDYIACSTIPEMTQYFLHSKWSGRFSRVMDSLFQKTSQCEKKLKLCLELLISLRQAGRIHDLEYGNRIRTVFQQLKKIPSSISQLQFMPQKKILEFEEDEKHALGTPRGAVHSDFYYLCWTSCFVFDGTCFPWLSSVEFKPTLHQVCQHLRNLLDSFEEKHSSKLEQVFILIYEFLNKNHNSLNNQWILYYASPIFKL
jgi:hypothetical protein